jgi:hypothetical protein
VRPGRSGGVGARDQQARAHAGLGRAHQSLGDSDRARTHDEQALAAYIQLGSPHADDIRAAITALEPTR